MPRLQIVLRQLRAENPATADIGHLRRLAREVIAEWELAALPPHKSYSDWARHLINHIRIKNRKSAKYRKPQTSKQHNRDNDSAPRQRSFKEFIADYLAHPRVHTPLPDWI